MIFENKGEVLNNKLECPVVGIGTFMLSPADAQVSVREALKMGYRLVDTANAYVNERAVGRGIKEIPEIAEHFADAVEKGFRESPQVDLESLSDYEQMKSKLSMEVVSAEKNAELLESVPHERMEDMAVVYRFVLDQTDSGNGTILVTNQLLEQYGITKEQLRADAMENAPEIRPSEIRGMSEVMSELAPGMIPEVAPEDEQMFVAIVPDKIHGAGVIAYPNFMEDAAQKMGGDFFVLPSSIHEGATRFAA